MNGKQVRQNPGSGQHFHTKVFHSYFSTIISCPNKIFHPNHNNLHTPRNLNMEPENTGPLEKENHLSRPIIFQAEFTLNGGLVRESPQNPLNSGLGIILISLDFQVPAVHLRGCNPKETKCTNSLEEELHPK